MNKFIVFTISIIILFFISFYIGMKFDIPLQDNKGQEKLEVAQKEVVNNNAKQVISEEDINKEHYVLRSVNGLVVVYSMDDDEKEELYLVTDISIDYLPETDKISLKDGIHVYSITELNEILQDFE